MRSATAPAIATANATCVFDSSATPFTSTVLFTVIRWVHVADSTLVFGCPAMWNTIAVKAALAIPTTDTACILDFAAVRHAVTPDAALSIAAADTTCVLHYLSAPVALAVLLTVIQWIRVTGAAFIFCRFATRYASAICNDSAMVVRCTCWWRSCCCEMEHQAVMPPCSSADGAAGYTDSGNSVGGPFDSELGYDNWP